MDQVELSTSDLTGYRAVEISYPSADSLSAGHEGHIDPATTGELYLMLLGPARTSTTHSASRLIGHYSQFQARHIAQPYGEVRRGGGHAAMGCVELSREGSYHQDFQA